ncbi:MAG: FAD-dependent oxidoreductase, partial [Pseudomonadota bacterium]
MSSEITRQNAVEELASRRFDIVVIGGGANGVGVALDAVTRGLEVALIERGDFASGTSSRSSKLIHGGIRYLAQGRISLVREALRERQRLLRNAGDLVHPLEFILPVQDRLQALKFFVGLKVYDWLARRGTLNKSRWLKAAELSAKLPTFKTSGLRGLSYSDARFDDAALTLSVIEQAVNNGATAANYLEAIGFEKEQGRISALKCRDLESNGEFSIATRMVVNCSGARTDQICRLDDPDSRSLVTLSQGTHVVLPPEFRSGDRALVFPETPDGRIMFA